MRGCTRGCRFCQAGIIYRPLRERPVEEVMAAVEALLAATGYEELSLISLSSCDHSQIEELVEKLLARYAPRHISISLPSLRIDSFSLELAALFQSQRKAGLTFAPEAGSQRLREAINKGMREEEILATMEAAFRAGWQKIKLYFMLGLPTETEEDVAAIGHLVRQIREVGRRWQGRRAQINISLATFVPKSHTPFQWVALKGEESLRRKQDHLRRQLRGPGLRLSWSDPETTLLEAALSRGDRRLGRVIYGAWKRGARMDAWGGHLQADKWWEAFAEEGLAPDLYARRQLDPEEPPPWEHIDVGVTTGFLLREYERALRGESTPDCREGCQGCGLLEAFSNDACQGLGRPER